jgi:ABC-2 type transport system permease protein
MTLEAAESPTAADAGPEGGFYPKYSLWHYVWKLLRLRAIITLSGFRRAKLGRKIFLTVLAVLMAAFAVFMFVMSWLLLNFLRSPALARALAQQNLGEVTTFLEGVPGLILAGAFLTILLTSFGVLLQALYLAGDMDFLLSAPVPIRAVFVTKLLQAILPNFSLIALFGLPVLLGLGVAGGYNVLYYPLVFVVLGVLALAAAGLSSLLVMGVARVIPARRVAEVLGFLGAIVSISCSQISNFMNATGLGRNQFGSVSAMSLSWAGRFNTPWSPLTWAGRGLVDLGQGRWLTGLGFLALTLGLAGGVFMVSLVTAERLYYTGWASLQTGTRKKRAGRAAPVVAPAQNPARASLGERLIPSAVRAIMLKDFLVLRRDPRQMSQVVMPIILGVIYGFALVRSGGNPPAAGEEGPVWLVQAVRSLIIYGSVGLSLLVGWMLLSRLALMSFSQEGKNYWMLKSAPVQLGQLLTAKFLVAYLPALSLGWAFMLVISLVQQTGLAVFLFGLGVVALSLAGTAGLNLALGVAGANLTWEDPRHMNSGWSGCLSMLVSLGYLAFSLGLFFLPPVILFSLGLPEAVGQLIGLALGGAASLACAIIAPRMVASRVALIGEG